jgi:PAS domain S-box-containing protein
MTRHNNAKPSAIDFIGWAGHILENMSDGFLVVNSISQEVTYVNRAAVQLSGKDKQQMVGRHLFEIFPEATEAIFTGNYHQTINTGRSTSFETYLGVEPYRNRYHFACSMGADSIFVHFRKLPSANSTGDSVAQVTNESLLTAERQQRLVAETLTEVTLALTSRTSLRDVLDEVLRQTQRLVPYRTAHIMLLKHDQLHIAGWQGYRELGSEELVSNLVQPLAEFPIDAEVIRSRRPLVIADTHQEPSWVVQEQTSWVRSHTVVPISLGEQVLGILRLDASFPYAFSQQDVVRLQPLTNAAAIAMENARLYDKAQLEIEERRQIEQKILRRNRELALLNQIIAASVTAVEPEDILQTTCEELAMAFDMPVVTATRISVDDQTAAIVAEYSSIGRSSLGQHFSTTDYPAYQHLVKNKTPLVINNISEDKQSENLVKIVPRGVTSLLMVPLLIDNKVVGSLNLQSIKKYKFIDTEINLTWRVADQVAGVLNRTQLDKEHRRLNAAIEQSAESVIITDTQGLIMYVNPSFERITGYSRAEVLGNKLNMLNSGKHDQAFYREMWNTIKSGNVWHGRIINKRKDGVLYTDEVIISPVRSESGTIVNYVGLQRDVTREQQLEEQYRQAQKMEAVGLLAGGIAHDFNNLLTVINGFAEMIQFEIPAESLHLQKLAGRVRYSGTRAAAMVRQLLAFSRREFVEPQVLNLNNTVTDTSQMLERLIEENIVLKTNLSPDLWPVKVDPHQIEQIIVNLTVNARDAMPDGGRLTIETQNQLLENEYSANHLGLLPGEYVLLTISDTGVGMTEAVKKRIFEPFFTTKEQGKGTGLGLATVFGIVHQYQGRIIVHSETGQGSTFQIYLPRAEAAAGSDISSSGGFTEIPRGTETVLVVEDEVTVRDLAAYMLRRQGYVVLEAANGEDALKVVQQQKAHIHLLLTDTVMPKMSGKALADEFRIQYPDTKILFTSGYTDKEIVRNSVLEPGIEFLPKPFSAAELARKVRLVLDS